MCSGEDKALPRDHRMKDSIPGGNQSVISAFPLLFTDGIVGGAVIPLARDDSPCAGTWSLNT